MPGTVIVLGLDPGFASAGWAIVGLFPDKSAQLISMGTFRTEKATKKQNVLAANDNFRRARELSKSIRTLLYGKSVPEAISPERCYVHALCAESMSFPRNASTAAKMAMCWGVVADICEDEGLPLFMATPKELKRAVCGKADAEKSEVQAALVARFGSKPEALLLASGVPVSQHEHAYDALAAVIACLDGETLRLLWNVAT